MKRYATGNPKDILYEMLHEIDLKSHFGYRRSWEVLIELLAYHLGLLSNPWIYSKPTMDVRMVKEECSNMIRPYPFPMWKNRAIFTKSERLQWIHPAAELSSNAKDILDHIEKTDMLEQYVVAARAKPWDHLGDLFCELELAGRKNSLGQMLTPKQIVDFMIKCVLTENEKTAKKKKPNEPITYMDPCVGTGRFLIEATLLEPQKPLILFGIEIDVTLYRACLVNMALFSNHPYSIIRADTLMLNLDASTPSGPVWNLGNLWDPADLQEYYFKMPPPFKFSLANLAKEQKEQPQPEQPMIVAPTTFSLAEMVKAKKKQ
ncbi:N-6 DNA methylase [Candidatus Bathyarchaeota archaeon]|nr:N-6 DNA methylase [Candidatus Bathyarchaeota archaeon]